MFQLTSAHDSRVRAMILPYPLSLYKNYSSRHLNIIEVPSSNNFCENQPFKKEAFKLCLLYATARHVLTVYDAFSHRMFFVWVVEVSLLFLFILLVGIVWNQPCEFSALLSFLRAKKLLKNSLYCNRKAAFVSIHKYVHQFE